MFLQICDARNPTYGDSGGLQSAASAGGGVTRRQEWRSVVGSCRLDSPRSECSIGGIFTAGDGNAHPIPALFGGRSSTLKGLALAFSLLSRRPVPKMICPDAGITEFHCPAARGPGEERRRKVMASPNQTNSRPGKYRCTDCGYEITVNKGGRFPRCPVHPHPAAWLWVRQSVPKLTPAKH